MAGYVPIPRAEYSDDKIDVVIENLILSGANLFPNVSSTPPEPQISLILVACSANVHCADVRPVVEISSYNHFKFSPYEEIMDTMKDTHHHTFRLGLSQIQADIRDVAFSFKRKSVSPIISCLGVIR